MNKIIINVIICYLIVSIDIFGGFKTNFNVMNWSARNLIKFAVILVVVSVIDFFTDRYKKK